MEFLSNIMIFQGKKVAKTYQTQWKNQKFIFQFVQIY